MSHVEGQKANQQLDSEYSTDSDIVVVEESGEPNWPETVPLDVSGKPHAPHLLFDLALSSLARFKSQFEWVTLFKQPGSGLNQICETPELLSALNTLFKQELSADLSVTQRSVFYEADCILIGREKTTKKVVAFGSSRYSPRGDLKNLGIEPRVTNAGIFVVAPEHARAKLGIMIPSVVALYGHTPLTIFQEEYTVIRINNKHLERVMLRGGRIFRFDRINPNECDEYEANALRVMEWTHNDVFHLKNQPLNPGCGVKVSHRFPDSVTMIGLEADEVTYVARISSIVRFVFLVFWRAGRKPKQPAP